MSETATSWTTGGSATAETLTLGGVTRAPVSPSGGEGTSKPAPDAAISCARSADFVARSGREPEIWAIRQSQSDWVASKIPTAVNDRLDNTIRSVQKPVCVNRNRLGSKADSVAVAVNVRGRFATNQRPCRSAVA